MEYAAENALNAVGAAVGAAIAVASYSGYRSTGSPTLLRLAIAFSAVSAGFIVTGAGYIDAQSGGSGLRTALTLGGGLQTVGYFFIAFSHGLKSFLPSSRSLRSVAAAPLLLFPYVQLEHVFKSVSYVLLIYAAIETAASYRASRNLSSLLVASGLGALALGEFLGWYSLVFPGSHLYASSIAIKIAGLGALFVPAGRIPLARLASRRRRR